LICTIALTQFERLGAPTFLILLATGAFSILFSIFAIILALHVKGFLNLFYFRSFAKARPNPRRRVWPWHSRFSGIWDINVKALFGACCLAEVDALSGRCGINKEKLCLLD
jgi:hypothetical protein